MINQLTTKNFVNTNNHRQTTNNHHKSTKYVRQQLFLSSSRMKDINNQEGSVNLV